MAVFPSSSSQNPPRSKKTSAWWVFVHHVGADNARSRSTFSRNLRLASALEGRYNQTRLPPAGTLAAPNRAYSARSRP